jgi:16S rRNA (cytidine1402-2'-O)-methyltransferase
MSSDPRGSLYLLPNLLGESDPEAVIPAAVLNRARTLDYLIAENPKAARAFLKRIGATRALQSIRIERLDHNTPPAELAPLLDPLFAGRDAGLLSEAGLPAVADPGAGLIRLAHQRGLRVVPLSGPSSILLALSASGLEGQRFAFNGYLPVPPAEFIAAIRELERRSQRLQQTQIFMETPYRNNRSLALALRALEPDTLVCVAADLTLQSETVQTQSVAAWRRAPPQLEERPAIFLILAASGLSAR